MTIEEAVKQLDSFKLFVGTQAREAINVVLTALRAQQEAEKNEPLTLEELLEMDGEPVWVDQPDGYMHYNGWALVFVWWKAQKQVRVTYPNNGSDDISVLFSTGWKIYRRPPTGEASTP